MRHHLNGLKDQALWWILIRFPVCESINKKSAVSSLLDEEVPSVHLSRDLRIKTPDQNSNSSSLIHCIGHLQFTSTEYDMVNGMAIVNLIKSSPNLPFHRHLHSRHQIYNQHGSRRPKR